RLRTKASCTRVYGISDQCRHWPAVGLCDRVARAALAPCRDVCPFVIHRERIRGSKGRPCAAFGGTAAARREQRTTRIRIGVGTKDQRRKAGTANEVHRACGKRAAKCFQGAGGGRTEKQQLIFLADRPRDAQTLSERGARRPRCSSESRGR